jgi:hypothetical protein
MYAWPASLLNRGKFAPAERGRPEEPFRRILGAPLGRMIWGAAIPLRGAVSE